MEKNIKITNPKLEALRLYSHTDKYQEVLTAGKCQNFKTNPNSIQFDLKTAMKTLGNLNTKAVFKSNSILMKT
jgi:hypothetical protein